MKSKLRRKCLSVLLAGCMIVALLPVIGEPMIVRAISEGGTSSVTAFATPEQLMDAECFTLANEDSSKNKVGYINFGKDANSNEMKWYIVGKDKGIEEDNVVLFATTSYGTVVFEEDYLNNKIFDENWGCVYTSEVLEVCANQYGASDVRLVTLKSIENDAEYFSVSEQNLMNETAVSVTDLMNNLEYVITDKLYLANGNYDDVELGFGTQNDLKVYESYWNDEYFWLRTANPDAGYMGFVAGLEYGVRNDYVNALHNVRPAFNLDLSSVLFASAVPVTASMAEESGIISADTAMNLRMNGMRSIASDLQIYSDWMEVTPKSEETVSLVVQGNDGTNDWYYCKEISGTETVTVTADMIKDIVGISESPKLANCEIWIEKNGDDGLIYAKQEVSFIDSVSVLDIAPPVAGVVLDTTAVCTTTGVEQVSAVTWTPADTEAVYNAGYTASVTLTAAEGYEFLDSTTAMVGGNAATSIVLNEDGTLTVTYTYAATATDVTCAPTADIVPGTYTENQLVALSTETEGAEIYYTLDGTEPSATNGSKYTEAISVTGEKGRATTTTIKAIAVKDGMQDSCVVTFEYIIELPVPKLLRVIAPSPITGVANGTAKTVETLGLPEKVAIVTEDESAVSALVTWNLEELASGSYDAALTTEQTFTVNGIVTLPEGIDANGIELKVQITVTVSAKADNGTDIIVKPWPFTDIPEMPGYWKYDNVKYVYDRGIMNGIAGTTLFDPDGKLNRAMFATVLYRMAGSPEVEFKNTFSDVEDGKYYSDAVMWVNEKGIAQGFQDGSYGVTRNITREQIAKMLCEYAMKQGYDASGRSSLESFTDKDSVNYWAVDYMQWTVNTGMISGKPNDDGSFRLDPKGDATRAECAKMLTMFLKKYEPDK